MEKAKEQVMKSILKDLEQNEKLLEKKDFIFKNSEDFERYCNFFYNLSEHKQRYMNSINNFLHDQKYHHRKGRILGTQSKAMPDIIYQQLIPYVAEHYGEKEKLALMFEGLQAPRGEDVVRVKDSDIDFEEHKVKIHNRKRDRWYQIPLNRELESKLKEFITNHKDDIIKHEHFILYSENPCQKRQHLSEKYLKNVVHNSLEALGLNKVYGVASNGRKLYLYSLHSLRGHAVTRVFSKNPDLRIAQKLLDHQPNSANTTMLYLENDTKDLEDVIN